MIFAKKQNSQFHWQECSEEKKEIIKSILKQNVPDVALQMAMQNAQIVRSPNIPMQDIPTTKSANAKNVE